MKIYTYYECLNYLRKDLNMNAQKMLLDVWKYNWSQKGFTPLVLEKCHAEAHPYYKQFTTKIKDLFKKIVGEEISDYGMSCYNRWLAFASQSKERFYVSDYDVLNINFPVQQPIEGVHFMDRNCPSFVSGSSIDFDNFCDMMIHVTENRLDILKQIASHYHDQELMSYNFFETHNPLEYQQIRDEHNITITTDDTIGTFYDLVAKNFFKVGPEETFRIIDQGVQICHIAHYNCGLLKKRYVKHEFDEARLRYIMMKKLAGYNE